MIPRLHLLEEPTPGGKHREDLYLKREDGELRLLSIEHHGDATPEKLGHGGGWTLLQGIEVATYLADQWRFALWRLESAESSAGATPFDQADGVSR